MAPACADSDGPLFLAGHQPELFHPGVWFKNFALSAPGRQVHAVAINLLIDNDILTTASIRVPRAGSPTPQVEAVAFDCGTEAVPFEERTIGDDAMFASFGERVEQAVGGGLESPLIRSYWPLVTAAASVPK